MRIRSLVACGLFVLPALGLACSSRSHSTSGSAPPGTSDAAPDDAPSPAPASGDAGQADGGMVKPSDAGSSVPSADGGGASDADDDAPFVEDAGSPPSLDASDDVPNIPPFLDAGLGPCDGFTEVAAGSYTVTPVTKGSGTCTMSGAGATCSIAATSEGAGGNAAMLAFAVPNAIGVCAIANLTWVAPAVLNDDVEIVFPSATFAQGPITNPLCAYDQGGSRLYGGCSFTDSTFPEINVGLTPSDPVRISGQIVLLPGGQAAAPMSLLYSTTNDSPLVLIGQTSGGAGTGGIGYDLQVDLGIANNWDITEDGGDVVAASVALSNIQVFALAQ